MRRLAIQNFGVFANDAASQMLRQAGPDFMWAHRNPLLPKSRLPMGIRSTKEVSIIIDRNKLIMSTIHETEKFRAESLIARLIRFKIWRALRKVFAVLDPDVAIVSSVRVSPFFDQLVCDGDRDVLVSSISVETIESQ